MANQFTEIGSTGLIQYAGQIQQDFLNELQGKEGYKRFNEMRLNSPIIGAMLMAIEQSVNKAEFLFTSDLGEEDPRLEILNDSIDGMSRSWKEHVIEALTFLPFGYCPFEIVYKREGSRILWRKLSMRGQDTVFQWLFDEEGGLEGFRQQTATNFQTVTIPIERLLIYRIRVERNNPEGTSILRNAWVPYYYAKNIQAFEAIGIERDLCGLPKITVPDMANLSDDSTDAQEANQLVRRIRQDEQGGVVIPNGWEFELISSGGSRQFDTDKVVKRYESRMLMSTLEQFLVLGLDKVGSQALSTDMSSLFVMSVDATADIISDTVTQHAIPRLMTLNGQSADGLALTHTPAGDIDFSAIADAFQKLGSAITVTPEDEAFFREILGMPNLTLDQIEEAREEQRERAAAFLPSLQSEDKEDQSKDEMSIEHYASGRSPDDNRRRKHENVMKREVKRFFKRQQDRVIKASKRLARKEQGA